MITNDSPERKNTAHIFKTSTQSPKDSATEHYQRFRQFKMHYSIQHQNEPQITQNDICPLQYGRYLAAESAQACELVNTLIFVAIMSRTFSFLFTLHIRRENQESQVSFSLLLTGGDTGPY